MAISDKEAARQVIDALPDDASLDDIVNALRSCENPAKLSGHSVTPVPPDASVDHETDLADVSVSYHVQREGWATVLVPDRPVPPITTEMVNELIEEMRRERDDLWLGPTEKTGE